MVRSAFQQHQASIVAIQCLWRCRQAKRELRRLKQVRFYFIFLFLFSPEGEFIAALIVSFNLPVLGG